MQRNRILPIFLALFFPIVNSAQTGKPPAEWTEFSKCGFTFSAPATLKDLKKMGVDSCRADFEDSQIKIFIDYGRFSPRFKKDNLMTDYREKTIEIDGEKAQFVAYQTYKEESAIRGNRKYISAIHLDRNAVEPENALLFIVFGKTENDMQTARRIFKTIKFKLRRN